jgi:hypothetical protein
MPRKWTPEERAAFEEELAADELRRRLAASIERLERQLADERARRERRRAFMRRLMPFVR